MQAKKINAWKFCFINHVNRERGVKMGTNKMVLAEIVTKMIKNASTMELHRLMGIIEGMNAAKDIHRETGQGETSHARQ